MLRLSPWSVTSSTPYNSPMHLVPWPTPSQTFFGGWKLAAAQRRSIHGKVLVSVGYRFSMYCGSIWNINHWAWQQLQCPTPEIKEEDPFGWFNRISFFCDTRFHHDSIYVPGTCQVTMGKRYRASAVRSGVLRAVRSSLTGLFWGTMKVFEGYIYNIYIYILEWTNFNYNINITDHL